MTKFVLSLSTTDMRIFRTNVLVNRLLGYTLNTGLITSYVYTRFFIRTSDSSKFQRVFAITEIITYRTMPHTLVFLAFVFVQSKRRSSPPIRTACLQLYTQCMPTACWQRMCLYSTRHCHLLTYISIQSQCTK
jgi:hypothetical protein